MKSRNRHPTRHRGGALIVALVLLSLVSLLALAAASSAHVELQLARNDWFRENAANAASAGIESAIQRIVSASDPENPGDVPRVTLPDDGGSYTARIRFLGLDAAVAQEPDAGLAAAFYEIIATGEAPRGAYDRQRAIVMRVVGGASPPADGTGIECEPVAPGVRCARDGDWRRVSWQRLARE